MGYLSSGARGAGLNSLLFVAVLLAGINMRGYVTGMGPVLDEMRASLGLSPSVAGLLVAVPTLCYGVFSLLVPQFLRVLPVRRLLIGAMLLIAFGVGLRSVLGVFGLFAGLFIASVGISVMMVIVPVIIKAAFVRRVGLVMSFYTMSFCLGASLGAGTAVPLARMPYSSWQWSLAFWVLPALAGALIWRYIAPHRLADPEPAGSAGVGASGRGLYRDKLAWQIALFMGLQSCVGQSFVGWMPAILVSRGMPLAEAGAALSITLLVQLVTNFAAPWLATRGRDQRLIISLMMALMLAGVLGVFYAPVDQAWLWVVMLGLGMGGAFAIAVLLLVLRTRSSREAAALSGMAQGVGYTVASAGPALVGVLYQYSHGWQGAALLFIAMCVVGWIMGMGAGRDRFVLNRDIA